jgi:hypothetical protein
MTIRSSSRQRHARPGASLRQPAVRRGRRSRRQRRLERGRHHRAPESRSKARGFGAEPLNANDAAASLRPRRVIANEREPDTLAHRARTISVVNWPVQQRGLTTVFEIPQNDIIPRPCSCCSTLRT